MTGKETPPEGNWGSGRRGEGPAPGSASVDSVTHQQPGRGAMLSIIVPRVGRWRGGE